MAQRGLLRLSLVEGPGSTTAVSGLGHFLAEKEKSLDAVLIATANAAYNDVIVGLGGHLDGMTRHRAADHEPLSTVIAESRESTVVEEMDSGVLSVGIGNVDLLETRAPHWKYLEFGTYDYREVGGWQPPPRLIDAPDAIVPEAKDGRKGVAPTRAWRYARHMTGAHLEEALENHGFHRAK